MNPFSYESPDKKKKKKYIYIYINPDKTELLVISSRFHQKPIPDVSIQFNDQIITLTKSIRNLGVIFDNNMIYFDQNWDTFI